MWYIQQLGWVSIGLDLIGFVVFVLLLFQFDRTAYFVKISNLFIIYLVRPIPNWQPKQNEKKKDKTNNILRNKFITNAFGEKITIAQRLQ